MSSKTIEYYESQAAEYSSATQSVDMSSLYAEFLPFMPQKGHILDAGCGSGRDALYFKNHGFKVSAFDASTAMAYIASELLQQPVKVLKFDQLEDKDLYDGIWCCASLLHVSYDKLAAVFKKLCRGLKADGLIYISFKYGDSERKEGSRHFTDLNESRLAAILQETSGLTLIKSWQTLDQRPERKLEVWFNALLTKLA